MDILIVKRRWAGGKILVGKLKSYMAGRVDWRSEMAVAVAEKVASVDEVNEAAAGTSLHLSRARKWTFSQEC